MVVGEFTVATSNNLTVQARFAPVACDCRMTIGSAAVISDGQHRIQVDRRDPATIVIDGEAHEFAAMPVFQAGDMLVERRGDGARITHTDGTVVSLTYHSSMVNVYLQAGVDSAEWTGIFGTNDRTVGGYITQDGRNLGTRPTQQELEGTYADSWRLTDETSLFSYLPGESTEAFTDRDYPAAHPAIESDTLQRNREQRAAQAETVCSLAIADPQVRAACVSDFVTTGSVEVVRSSRSAEAALGLYPRVPATAATVASDVGDVSQLPEGATIWEETGAPLVIGDGLALIRATVPDGDDDDGASVLIAVDTADRAVRWVAPDISTECRAALIPGVGIVAAASNAEGRLGDDRAALVLLSAEDGSEIARFADDGSAGCHDIHSGGDVLVTRHGTMLRGFRVAASGFTPLWEHESAWRSQLAVVGDAVLQVESSADKSVDYAVLDLATGETRSTVTLTRVGNGRGLTVLPGGLVLAAHGEAVVEDSITLLDLTGGTAEVRWTRRVGDTVDDPPATRIPRRMAPLGDLLIGWTGEALSAFRLADGSAAWTFRTSSFENNNEAIASTDTSAFVGPFGRAWSEAVGVHGYATAILPDAPVEGWNHPSTITRVDGGTVLLTGKGPQGQPYFAFLDG